MERLGDASWEGPSGWQEWVGVKGESEEQRSRRGVSGLGKVLDGARPCRLQQGVWTDSLSKGMGDC